MIGLFVFVGAFSALTISAQKYPIALQTDTDLSPRNKTDYEAIIAQYKIVACLGNGIPAPCARNVAEATRLRNNLIRIALGQSDAVFKDYRQGRRHKTQIFELFMDLLEIGLSVATSVTNGERAKTVVSGVLSFIQLGHKSADKTLLLKETQVLFNAMIAKRATIKQEIITNLTGNDDQYSFLMGLADVVRYYSAGTIDEALSELESTTAMQKDKALSDLKNVTDALAGKPATREQRNRSVGAFEVLNGLLEDSAAGVSDARKLTALQKLIDITDAISDSKLVPTEKDNPLLNSTFNDAKKLSDAAKKALKEKTALAGDEGDKLARAILNFRKVASTGATATAPATAATSAAVAGFQENLDGIDQLIVEKGQ
jgi:hypothetical protein